MMMIMMIKSLQISNDNGELEERYIRSIDRLFLWSSPLNNLLVDDLSKYFLAAINRLLIGENMMFTRRCISCENSVDTHHLFYMCPSKVCCNHPIDLSRNFPFLFSLNSRITPNH